MRVNRRDRLFAAADRCRFRTSRGGKPSCSKLVVGEEVVEDLDMLLKVWADHFQHLGESKLGQSLDSCEWIKMVDSLAMSSLLDEDCLLDVPFTTEDISRAIKKLKARKAPGPDGLMAEHLKAGGEVIYSHMADEGSKCSGRVGSHSRGFEERCHCANIQGWRKGSIEN